MKRLLKFEEIKILRELSQHEDVEDLYIDNGSSRLVIHYGNDKVIKIACDNGGRMQNHFEIETFKNNSEMCAEIFAYGRNIIIMEKVKPIDTGYRVQDFTDEYDIEDWFLNCVQEEYELDDFDKEILNLFYDATNVLGYSTDNFQIGMNSEEKLVLFDYGFNITTASASQMIGDMDYWYSKFGVKGILNKLEAKLLKA